MWELIKEPYPHVLQMQLELTELVHQSLRQRIRVLHRIKLDSTWGILYMIGLEFLNTFFDKVTDVRYHFYFRRISIAFAWAVKPSASAMPFTVGAISFKDFSLKDMRLDLFTKS